MGPVWFLIDLALRSRFLEDYQIHNRELFVFNSALGNSVTGDFGVFRGT